MELPVKMPVSGRQRASYRLQAKELFYEIRSRGGDGDTKHVLKKVCCEARPGEILAIVGPSGAGKTTLLEILAGMIPLSRFSGEILVNGGPIDVGKFRRLSGYVTQDDALFPLLTVEETLMYSARLRLRGGTHQALTRVRELLKELGLDHISGSRVGGNDDTYGGISGGERRRVSIGVDVVHDPAVLFLDEPTSGLDSASALQVVSLLKSMAVNQGKTIITTIHQPGFRILELFNGIVLLSEGTVVHHGSVQSLESRLKLAGHCIPRHVNVLEFAIDVIQGLGIKTQIVDHGFFLDFNSDGKDHESNGKHQQQEAIIYSSSIKEMPFSYANSQYEEILILSRRISSNIFRTKQLFATRSIQSLVVGFMLGTIFMNVYGNDTTAALQTQAGFFAFSLTFLLSSTTEGLPIYLQERRILMREISRGAYRVSSYVIANTLVFIPFLLMVALLYTTPVYWLVGLRRELDGYLYYSLVVWMVILMANSFVACFSALVPNFIMGNSLIAGFMGSFFLFSGYFISKRSIPKYWIFMHYLSLFKYPFEAFMINEYGGKKGKRCIQSQMGQCFLDGKGFLMQQELKESQKWSNLGVMLGFICGYRVLCFLILWYRCHRTRI